MTVGSRYPTASGKRTVGQWDDFFHTRRRALFPDLPDPEPTTHFHTFARTQGGTAPQSLRYANGSTCAASLQQAFPKTGTITVMPAFVTKLPLTVTAVSGSATSIDLPKVDDDTMHSFTHRASDWRTALNGVTLGAAGGRPCSLSLAFQNLPGQPDIAASVPGFATWSGPTCTSTSTGAAELAGPQLFVRGLGVCTGGTFSQVKGIEVHSARVDDDGTVDDAVPTKRFALAGCSRWHPARFCPQGRVATGVKTFFTVRDGFTGLALECKTVVLDPPA